MARQGLSTFVRRLAPIPDKHQEISRSHAPASREASSNRPVVAEVVDTVDEAARGEECDDLRRRLLGGLIVARDDELRAPPAARSSE